VSDAVPRDGTDAASTDARHAVLLVGDDREDLALLRAGIGCHPRWKIAGVASSLEETTRALSDGGTDVALIDLRWPRAVEAASLVARQVPRDRCAVVFRSGHSADDVALVAQLTGAIGVLHDDVPARDLGRALARLTGVIAATRRVLRQAMALPPDTVTPGAARELVASALEGTMPDEIRDAAVLLVSELATNAVLHAGTAVDVVVISLSDRIRVEVSDRSSRLPQVQPHDPLREGGHGLEIVAAQATNWGIIPKLDGKVVWFELAHEAPDVDVRLALDPTDPTDGNVREDTSR
jgi:DNA-binding NarL/FixJ family response regulator